MSIYILTVTRIANLSYNKHSFYIDSVFDSEEKAWNRIEEKFYNLLRFLHKKALATAFMQTIARAIRFILSFGNDTLDTSKTKQKRRIATLISL